MAAELIALESVNQSAFTKAVKKIKKSIETKKGEEAVQKNVRGIILVQHLPYGFFEEGLRSFFSQFGTVMRLRLARSKKTGRSKGYAFVEFEFEEVAKIAAESMNNYLMFERLVKCKLLPPGSSGKKIFAGYQIREDNNPKLKRRTEMKKRLANPLSEEDKTKHTNSRLNRIVDHNEKLAALGINYQFKLSSTDNKAAIPKEECLPIVEIVENIKAETSPARRSSLKKTDVSRISISSTKTTPSPQKSATKRKSVVFKEEPLEEKVVSNKKTPEKKPKFSPKVLRSRTRQSVSANEMLNAIRAELPEQPKPKTPSKVEKLVKEKEIPKPKFSPKLLRSRTRQSEGIAKPPVSVSVAKKNQRKSIK